MNYVSLLPGKHTQHRTNCLMAGTVL